MQQERADILEHGTFAGDYRLLVLRAPGIAPAVRPGQFVHVRLPRPADAILRRPFSVFRTGDGTLSLLYKAVGRGTAEMRTLQPGEELDLVGPLGNGFPADPEGRYPVLVAGGYGMAALYLLARALRRTPGHAFVGGKSAEDILCVHDFEALGWTVETATEDGSLGTRGLVTSALQPFLEDARGKPLVFHACGPNAMLRAVGELAARRGDPAWLSIDRHMGCGVGACLTCVQRIRGPDGRETWLRVCREGPVFEARSVVWDDA